ncbi:DMT family transporter [Alkaliphilus sp. MSJ-5]|uniref:DMT family transporter n=1 Tax=Alkaliphilus flagellatus TaxID=2841507 RepID=A0ABS6G214_9FIRM|nr:DMT family transporter [Alkaliphilus flagellatus]MBU5676424.1 DMT family transporter [Alkaliphilus flagellatus]
MIYALFAIGAGVSIVIARIINSNLADKIGVFQGTFFNYVIGLLFSSIFLLLSTETFSLAPQILKTIPFWAYLGGLVGVVVVAMSNIVTPKVSTFYLTLIIFIGQLLAGIIIDYYTLSLISKGKIIGGLLVVAGLTYNLIIDKKQLDENKL